MQVEVKLSRVNEKPLGYSYNYVLSSALMKAISVSNPLFGKDLHDGAHQSRLKLLVFSPLNSDPKPQQVPLSENEKGIQFGERLWLRAGAIWPEAIYALSDALMRQGKIDVAGLELKVEEVKMVPTPTFKKTMTYRCFGQSGMIVARYQKEGIDYFQFPDDANHDIPSCQNLLAANLRHKMLRLGEIRKDIQQNYLALDQLKEEEIREMPINIEFLPLNASKPFRSGLYKIKTLNVRAFRCPVRVTAPEFVHQVIWNCGLGGLNTQGFGLVTLGEKKDVSDAN